jgi:hypothetical protein
MNIVRFISILTVAVLVILEGSIATAGEIEISSLSGQTMTAEVLGYTASSGNVKIKRSDGQVFNTSLSVFDEASPFTSQALLEVSGLARGRASGLLVWGHGISGNRPHS